MEVFPYDTDEKGEPAAVVCFGLRHSGGADADRHAHRRVRTLRRRCEHALLGHVPPVLPLLGGIRPGHQKRRGSAVELGRRYGHGLLKPDLLLSGLPSEPGLRHRAGEPVPGGLQPSDAREAGSRFPVLRHLPA